MRVLRIGAISWWISFGVGQGLSYILHKLNHYGPDRLTYTRQICCILHTASLRALYGGHVRDWLGEREYSAKGQCFTIPFVLFRETRANKS